MFRLALVPCFVISFVYDWWGLALLFFITAGVTDLVDGFLARRLNQHSRLGAILDPIADKLLMASTFICLASIDHIPWWFVILMLGKDIFIVGGISFFMLMKFNFDYQPIVWSKLTTLLLLLLGSCGLVELVWPRAAIGPYYMGDFVYGGVYLLSIMIIITTLEYLRIGIEVIRDRND